MSHSRKGQPNNEKVCKKFANIPQSKEYVVTYEQERTRKILVPSRDPIDIPGILNKSEFNRLKDRSHIVTLKDKMQMLDEATKLKAQLQMESEKRKQVLRDIQKTQQSKTGTKLNDVEREAKANTLYLLQRSHDLLQEQDNRVKAANRVILATKCRAIRNAQIAEKELIDKQLREEDMRLDMMMEQQRQKDVEAAEQKQANEEKKKQQFIKELSEQVRLNDVAKMIEAEQKEEESKQINRAFLVLQRENEEKHLQKMELQQKIRDDLMNANRESEKCKLIHQEEQRISDLRIKNFMQQKLERELAREQELSMIKMAKEQEIQRLRAQQQGASDRQAMVNEMNAKRVQEEVERKWRESQLAAAKAKKTQQDLMAQQRELQIEDLRKAAAFRLAKDEEDFHKVAKVQRELWEKDMEKQKKKKEEAELHRHYLLKQINEKERERIMQQREKFEEGKMQHLEQKRKDLHVKEHLKKKIDDLRSHKIPEQYVQEIENNVDEIIRTK